MTTYITYRQAHMTRRERFWRWIRRLAERRIQSIHRQRSGSDTRCPNCGRWGSMHGFRDHGEVAPHLDAMTCNACDHRSVWLDIGFMGMAVPVGLDGTPLPETKHPMVRLEKHE